MFKFPGLTHEQLKLHKNYYFYGKDDGDVFFLDARHVFVNFSYLVHNVTQFSYIFFER